MSMEDTSPEFFSIVKEIRFGHDDSVELKSLEGFKNDILKYFYGLLRIYADTELGDAEAYAQACRDLTHLINQEVARINILHPGAQLVSNGEVTYMLVDENNFATVHTCPATERMQGDVRHFSVRTVPDLSIARKPYISTPDDETPHVPQVPFGLAVLLSNVTTTDHAGRLEPPSEEHATYIPIEYEHFPMKLAVPKK